MEEGKEDKVSQYNNFIMYGMTIGGALVGFYLAHHNKQRSMDYLTGIAGGIAVGVLAGYTHLKVRNAFRTLLKKEEPKNDVVTLSASSKFDTITIQRTEQ